VIESNINQQILNIAFYRFVELSNLVELRGTLLELGRKLNLKGTILLSTEGINANLAGLEENIREFQESVKELPFGTDLNYKDSYSNSVPFKRYLVKIKKEIIPVGDSEIKPTVLTGARISPKELKLWLDENRDFEFLDTRNEFEVEFGTFTKAKHLKLKHFRQFSDRLKTLPEEYKLKPMVMFCTGGIRCEKATTIAIKNGYKDVYQLDGGILKYFEECGGAHYQGECFVFDGRLTLNSQLQASADKAENLEELEAEWNKSRKNHE
jgi:predicted sulfurtransferase